MSDRLCAFGAIVFVAQACLAAGSQPDLRINSGGWIDLRLDPARVAVLVDPASQEGFAEDLSLIGLDASVISGHAVRGWSIVEVNADSPDAVRGWTERIGLRPGVRFATPVFVDDLGGQMFPKPRLLVARAPDAQDAHLGEGFVIEQIYKHAGLALVRVDGVLCGFDLIERSNALSAEGRVRFAEPDMVFTGSAATAPNDPFFGSQWALHNTGQSGGTPGVDMNALGAWAITTGSPSVITVIIDTGVQQDHPDINQIPGTDTTSDPSDDGGPVNSFDNHGTPVAGCVSAIADNGIGVAGIAPATMSASARTFIAVNTAGNWNSASSWTVATLDWAVSIGASITNNSNYYGFASPAIASVYASTRNNGMVHFASAGNDAQNTLTYPAILPTVNGVAAVTRNGTRASFSNFSNSMSVSAPGAQVFSTDRTGWDGYGFSDYISVSGTSYASPYAAGVAALVLSVDPSLSPDEVESILHATATDLGAPGFDPSFGHGMVDAHAAVIAAGACAADINADGVVDADDFFLFLSYYANGDPRADINRDGVNDPDDFFAFLGLFAAGC